MGNKYIDNDGILCFFKKCSICHVNVLSTFDGEPETHNKKCNKDHKLFKLQQTKKEVENAKEKIY